MAQSSMELVRAWRGPALFSYGFRPFFLFGAGWAVLSMLLWLGMLAGLVDLPTRFDPVSWHAHEFLFGYLGAVFAGFLLTAVPNWTGRLPMVGWPLIGLFALWSLGRVAIMGSALLPSGYAAVIDLAFPVVLGALILQEIVAGKNWRNLIVLALLSAFALANAVFHLEAASGEYAAQGNGLRLGLATAVMMISVIGGRIIPSFTRNWLVRQNADNLPVPPMQPFDKATLLVTLACLLLWVFQPHLPLTGVLLVGAGVLHLLRLLRWQGHQTAAEPLLWALHVSYVFIPAGALALGVAILTDKIAVADAQHLWTAGAIGGMTLVVMTRATLGHTGQPLCANRMTLLIYLALFAAVAVRFVANGLPELVHISGCLWLVAFCGFLWAYAPLLMCSKTVEGDS